MNPLLKTPSCNQLPNSAPPQELPNSFAKFFEEKINKIHQSLDAYIVPDSSIDINSVSYNGPKFDEFSPVSVAQVRDVLNSLNSTHCSLDPLPSTILKQCFVSTISAITSIINNSLQTSKVPLDYKKAIISPLLKNRNLDVNTLSNFRPISHLPFLSKALEKVVASQLNEHLVQNNILDKFQSAYRTGFSTETALIKISDDILQALDNKSFTALLMIDMSSAFDTIDHNILLSRLHNSFGVANSVLSWFKSYLHNRSQCVIVNNIASKSVTLSSGVPQGSVLAPLLFTLYLQPLANVIREFGFDYHFYADDVQFYITFDHTLNFDAGVIVKCLTAVEQWLAINKLKLNSGKTQCVLSRPPR